MVSITGNWSGQRLVAAGCNAPSWGINHSEREKIHRSARKSPFRLRLKNSGLCLLFVVGSCRRA